MLVAAIKSGSPLAGKAVVYNEDDDSFSLTGVGAITATKLLEFEDRRQLEWADLVTREWTLETAAIKARAEAAAGAAAEAAVAAAAARAAAASLRASSEASSSAHSRVVGSAQSSCRLSSYARSCAAVMGPAPVSSKVSVSSLKTIALPASACPVRMAAISIPCLLRGRSDQPQILQGGAGRLGRPTRRAPQSASISSSVAPDSLTTMRATALTTSPSRRFMTRTPCVARP